MKQSERKISILDAAFRVALEQGFHRVTQTSVATAATVAVGLVGTYFSMAEIREWVLREAIRVERLDILAAGMAAGHPVAWGAPGELRARAIASVGGDL